MSFMNLVFIQIKNYGILICKDVIAARDVLNCLGLNVLKDNVSMGKYIKIGKYSLIFFKLNLLIIQAYL